MREPPEFPPSLDDIARLAERVAVTLPDPIRRHLAAIVVRVEDFCDEETEQSMGLDGPYELLGLYHGIALSQKSLFHVPQEVDSIALYRLPILDYWCETGEALSSIVRHVLIHEIGHHLGLSDEDMERIESEQ